MKARTLADSSGPLLQKIAVPTSALARRKWLSPLGSPIGDPAHLRPFICVSAAIHRPQWPVWLRCPRCS
jgi:hypothetical protein